jgi:TRAP-type C4-dicarboxylate transport system permease small subunit
MPEDDKPSRLAWAAPLDRLDRAWTRLESRLCALVLLAEVLTLVFWISMKALSSTGRGGPGLVYRCLATALVLGWASHRISRRSHRHEALTTAAVLAGILIGRTWGDLGAAYFANFFAWLQNASFLVFFGGVSELAKRFTLWLALLGASVATAQGKHINVDVVMRFLGPRGRVPIAVLGWMTAAVVSATAAWGFFDNLAVEDFRAQTTLPCPGDESRHCAAPWQTKVHKVVDDTGRNLFLASRQLSLDVMSFPKVLAGRSYSEWLTPAEWNAWLRAGGWERHFRAEDVAALELPEDGTIEYRTPAVTAIPGGSEPIPRILVGLLNMVFPFGLFVIAIRFVLRSFLALTGWVKVDPNAAHGDEELAHAHDHSAQADAVEDAIEETVR